MMSRWLPRLTYIAACGVIAWYAWASWSEAVTPYKNEVFIMVTILLQTLTLPISVLIGVLYAGLAIVTPIDRVDLGSPIANWLVGTWAPLVVAGYAQWFLVLPWLMHKWRSRREGAIRS